MIFTRPLHEAGSGTKPIRGGTCIIFWSGRNETLAPALLPPYFYLLPWLLSTLINQPFIIPSRYYFHVLLIPPLLIQFFITYTLKYSTLFNSHFLLFYPSLFLPIIITTLYYTHTLLRPPYITPTLNYSYPSLFSPFLILALIYFHPSLYVVCLSYEPKRRQVWHVLWMPFEMGR